MKKAGIFFLSFVFAVSLVSSASIEMDSEFDREGLMIVIISGNFEKIPKIEDIVVFRRDTPTIIALENRDLKKIGEDYYFSAKAPINQGNYTLEIGNIIYRVGREFKDSPLLKNFSVSENLADFSVIPGTISAKESFSIKIENLKEIGITLSAKLLEIEDIFSLRAGESRTLNFNAKTIPASVLNYLEIETENTKYNIPVFIFEGASDEEPLEKRFEFIPTSINATFATNSPGKRIIYLSNTGGQNLENISLIVSRDLRDLVILSADSLDKLEKDSMVRIEVDFPPQEKEGYYEGHISAREGFIYSYLPVSIDFIKDYIPEENDTIDPFPDYKIPPIIEDEPEETNLGKTIGWVILILVILVVAWFFIKKYKGVKGKSVKF